MKNWIKLEGTVVGAVTDKAIYWGGIAIRQILR